MSGKITTLHPPFNSVSRSNALLAPLANTSFLTIPSSDLPSGYYQFDTIVSLQIDQGSENGTLADTRNFRINIEGFPSFTPQAVLGQAIRTTGFINLNGNQSIELKTGDVNGTANLIYSISVFLTKLG